MKTNFKRLFALVLTLCMLASVMVPVAFAEDAAVEAPAASATVAETYPIRLVDMTNPDYNTATGYSRWFKGGSGWKDILMATVFASTTAVNPEGEYAAGNLNWRFIGTNDAKYRYNLNVLHQVALNEKGTWAALQIRVSEAGRYALNLHTDKTDTVITDAAGETIWSNIATQWKGDVTAYIIPLADYNAAVAEGAEVNPAIESLMTEENCLGTQTLAADETDVTFKKVRMEAGEYVVVYSASALTYCISEMTLLEDAADAAMYETEQVVTYPIRLADPSVAPENATGLALIFRTGTEGAYTYKRYAISNLATSIADEYAAGERNWKYLATDDASPIYYRETTALQPRSSQGAKVALQIKVDNAGSYSLTVGVDRNSYNQYGVTNAVTSAFNVSAYLINAKTVESVTAENIATLTVAENSVGTVALAADASYGEFERTYLDAGEYVLIYELSAQAAICEFGLAQRKYEMNVTAEGAPAVTQHIELNARDINDGTPLAGAGGYADVSEYMNTAYAAGAVDWKIENYADLFSYANFQFVAGKGLKAATPADSQGDWFAIRIRVKQDGNYSLSLKSAGEGNQYSVYMFPAAAETMAADQIAAQMTAENGIHFNGYNMPLDAKISAGYLDGEYILVFQSIHETNSRTIYIDDIILETEEFTAEDVQFYNLNVFDETNEAYYELVSNRYTATTVDGVTTYEKMALANGHFAQANYVLSKDAEGNPAELGELYKIALQKNGLGYPATLNWRPDAGNVGDVDKDTNDMKIYKFVAGKDPAQSTVFYFGFTAATTDFTQYASLMLHVDKAGTYDLSLATGKNAATAKIYFVDSFASNAANVGRMPLVSDATIQNIMANGTGLLSDGYTELPAFATVDLGRVTVDTAGDFLILFEADPNSNAVISLTDITLTPVVEEGIARVGSEKYATFEAAVEAAEAGETVTLLDNVVAGDVLLGAGVTLNLNGYALNAQSVDSMDEGANVIDSGDGIGKLRVSDEIIFDGNNKQLPIYNATEDYYAFFNVEVESCATTGSGNASKYWFKVNFFNSDALALIGEDTELRIQAQLYGVYSNKNEELAGTNFTAIASADAAFSYMWAATSNSYITVSAVGSSGIDSFELKPAVTANGVVISGDAMYRND